MSCYLQIISVVFNAASGLSRVTTSHTCSATTEIPTTYTTYLDFARNFHCILDSDVGWIMDAVGWIMDAI